MTRNRSRRALLRTGALAVGSLAGCVGSLGDRGDGGDDGSTPTATTRERSAADGTSRTETATESPTTARPSVEFAPVGVQSSFFYLTSPDSMDVEAVDGVQFAFVEVRPRTASPPPSDFALVADGRHYWGTLAPGDAGGPNRLVELGPGYSYEDADPGWVAFEVPDPLDAAEVVLAHDGRTRPVGDDLLAALRTPPADFELVSFDAPEEVSPGDPFEVSFAVENVGEADGTFRASVNQSGPTDVPHRAEFRVPAGTRRERTVRFDGDSNAEADAVGLQFRSAVADRETTVEVVSGPPAE
jgi:hypothetical protein